MADHDVAVLELTTPAATAPLAQCRPVVSVRNNGLHDAVASGYVRIYSAGLLIYESEVYSDTIGPGETRPASAVDLWTPPAEGVYMVQGYVSTPLDQVEPNNNLLPTAVTISGIEPPPPTPVPLHASQHEEGGADEMSLEDLPGRAADQQRPINHASNHELSGTDPVNVDGMPGVLAEAQTPKAHATSHKVGGGDGLSVLALPDATDLELLARKNLANGYAGLDANGQVGLGVIATSPGIDGTYVPVLSWPSLERIWLSAFTPSIHADSHAPDGADPIAMAGIVSAIEPLHNFVPGMGLQELIRLDLTAAQVKPGTTGIFDFAGQIIAAAGGGQSVDIQLAYQDPGALTPLAVLSIPVASGATYWLAAHLSAGLRVALGLIGTAHAVADQPGAPVADIHYIAWSAAALVAAEGAGYFKVSIGWTAGQVGSTVNIHAATGQGVIRP